MYDELVVRREYPKRLLLSADLPLATRDLVYDASTRESTGMTKCYLRARTLVTPPASCVWTKQQQRRAKQAQKIADLTR